jgi:hypothetical protein
MPGESSLGARNLRWQRRNSRHAILYAYIACILSCSPGGSLDAGIHDADSGWTAALVAPHVSTRRPANVVTRAN